MQSRINGYIKSKVYFSWKSTENKAALMFQSKTLHIIDLIGKSRPAENQKWYDERSWKQYVKESMLSCWQISSVNLSVSDIPPAAPRHFHHHHHLVDKAHDLWCSTLEQRPHCQQIKKLSHKNRPKRPTWCKIVKSCTSILDLSIFSIYLNKYVKYVYYTH